MLAFSASQRIESCHGDLDAFTHPALHGIEHRRELLVQGLSNRRIAKRLGISEHTAKFHVNGILLKLGAGTRTEAVVQAARRGLIAL